MPKSVKVRRSQGERRDEAEQRLVGATLDVINESGVSAATFETIGQRAGYSRGLATQHFGSKQGLIDAVVDFLHQQQDAAMASAHVDDRDGLDALLAYINRYCTMLKRSAEAKAYFMLLSASVADLQETREVFAQSHVRVKARLAKLIERGQKENLIRRDLDPDATALMIGSLLLGLSMQSLIDPRLRVDSVAQAISKTIVRGLAPVARKVSNG